MDTVYTCPFCDIKYESRDLATCKHITTWDINRRITLVLCKDCGLFDKNLYEKEHVCDYNVPTLEESDFSSKYKALLSGLAGGKLQIYDGSECGGMDSINEIYHNGTGIYTVDFGYGEFKRFRGLPNIEYTLLRM